jgi:SAM-dependent methyltransferase
VAARSSTTYIGAHDEESPPWKSVAIRLTTHMAQLTWVTMNETTKQRLSRIARSTRLLACVDYALFIYDRFRHRGANSRFAARCPDYPIPPSDLMFEAFGHSCSEVYQSTGRRHAQLIAELLKQHLQVDSPRVCEWGCGPARIIRHLSEELGAQEARICGVDFNPRSIEWCQQHISGVEFKTNQLHPPLPFPDDSFDFIYALSVFTHLDEPGWYEWLSELSRITAEGGVVLFTTHGRNYLEKLLPDEAATFSSGKPVFRANTPRGKKCFAAYHPAEFVRSNLPATFRVGLHEEAASAFGLNQDVWVVKAVSQKPEPNAFS